MFKRLPAFTLATLSLAACVDDPAVATDEQEIVNGLVDTGHPSAARITSPTGATCTGVLITRNAVLTAKHCLIWDGTYQVELAGGGSFTGPLTLAKHPSVDLGLIITSDTTPRAFAAGLATSVSAYMPITLVGYGRTALGTPSDGVRRYGTNTIDEVDGTMIYFDTDLLPSTPAGTDSATCHGDSGGPAYLGDASSNCVGGISHGQDVPQLSPNQCSAAGGRWEHTRADNQHAWISSQLTVPIQPCSYTLRRLNITVNNSMSVAGVVNVSNPAGSCSDTCGYTYANTTSVTLIAPTNVPECTRLTSWSGACTGTSTSCTVSVNMVKNVTANFSLIPNCIVQ